MQACGRVGGIWLVDIHISLVPLLHHTPVCMYVCMYVRTCTVCMKLLLSVIILSLVY